MSNKLIAFCIVYLLAVFISSLSQILLKKSAQDTHSSALTEYLNPRVILAYTLFFGSTMITVFALKYVPLSLGTILESMGYIFVTILGIVFLKEHVNKKKWFGLSIILIGILIYSL